jgi:hypothetical protein
MNQRNPTRTILAVIITSALVISVGGLTALHTFPADATKPKHNDDDDNGNNSGGDNVVNTLPQQAQPQAQQAQPQAQQAQQQAQQNQIPKNCL